MSITRFIAIVTLFPKMYASLNYGVIGNYLKTQALELKFFNPRDYAKNKHNKVDDKPYGGGPGMVMCCQPLDDAINSSRQWLETKNASVKPTCIYMSPQGKILNQTMVKSSLMDITSMIIVAGRYEAIDERILQLQVDLEISVGDFVVSGGELPSMLLLDAWIRCLPNALGNEFSNIGDSFASEQLLQYPQYTRPEVYKNMQVPKVLLSGDHSQIKIWRNRQKIQRTQQKRGDLINKEIKEKGKRKKCPIEINL